MTTIPTYGQIDSLVDADPLKLRDVAWDLVREVKRLRSALQVCEHVAHRVEPSDAEHHAAQQASGAYCTEWVPAEVFDDLPDFEYRIEETR